MRSLKTYCQYVPALTMWGNVTPFLGLRSGKPAYYQKILGLLEQRGKWEITESSFHSACTVNSVFALILM